MKTTTLTVAAAAIVMFAQSAYAREHHHGHHHHHHMAAGRDGRSESGVTTYRGRDQWRPAAWCGWEMRRLVGADPGPTFNLARTTGPTGAGRGLRGSALLSCGRITSERSSVAKTANGSSNPAMMAMPFAAVLARLSARSRSVGADLRFHLYVKAKGPPGLRAALSFRLVIGAATPPRLGRSGHSEMPRASFHRRDKYCVDR